MGIKLMDGNKLVAENDPNGDGVLLSMINSTGAKMTFARIKGDGSEERFVVGPTGTLFGLMLDDETKIKIVS